MRMAFLILLAGCGGEAEVDAGRPWVLCGGGNYFCEKRCTITCWGDLDGGTHIISMDPTCKCTWASGGK